MKNILFIGNEATNILIQQYLPREWQIRWYYSETYLQLVKTEMKSSLIDNLRTLKPDKVLITIDIEAYLILLTIVNKNWNIRYLSSSVVNKIMDDSINSHLILKCLLI